MNYYKDIFASPTSCFDNGMIEEEISPMVSEVDNIMLTSKPTWDEVRNAVFGMKASGAPGPDGFNGYFFQEYWDVVGKDVFNTVKQFFSQSWLPPNMNSNNVVLIPKLSNADSIAKYRSIALANYQFKIISKILVDRLAAIAPLLISDHQRGFIRGWAEASLTAYAWH